MKYPTARTFMYILHVTVYQVHVYSHVLYLALGQVLYLVLSCVSDNSTSLMQISYKGL